MSDFIKKPCKNCPYRKDVKPFLTPIRGEELAYLAQNPYSTFTCHKTLEHDDEGNAFGSEQKICAGFLSLQSNELGGTYYDDNGFQASDNVYSDSCEMIDAYSEEED